MLDLTNFITEHPGGKKALVNYVNKDITDILFKVYPHKKDTILKVLERYKIGTLLTRDRKRTTTPPPNFHEKSILKEKKKVCFDKDVTDKTEVEKRPKSKKKIKKTS